jgi:hypothetical protein
VVLSPERDELLFLRRLIEGYLRDALGLELNPRERLRPVSHGIDFLGYLGERRIRDARDRRPFPAALFAREQDRSRGGGARQEGTRQDQTPIISIEP